MELLTKENQEAYYKALGNSDKIGASTPFIEFMLGIILQALEHLLKGQNRTLTVKDRIELFRNKVKGGKFSRKDYLLNYKEIKEATASRDLKWAVEQGVLTKTGDKRLTKYLYK